MRKATIVSVLLSVLVAGMAQADTFRYRLSGNWATITDGAGEGWGLNPNNSGAPGTVLPGGGDQARINWGGNTVTVDSVVPTADRIMIGVDESGNVVVENGGVLTGNNVLAGNNNANATGTLTINGGGVVTVNNILWAANNDSDGNIIINNGGTVTVGSHLWWGVSGTATIDIFGTLTQTGGILGLGTSNAADPGGGTATVNIGDGGLLALNNISSGGGGPSIQPGSLIDITGTGQLTLPGDFLSTLGDYVSNGQIVGEGLLGNVNIDLTTNPGFTTITVPEPSTLALLGLAGVALAVRRMSRKV